MEAGLRQGLYLRLLLQRPGCISPSKVSRVTRFNFHTTTNTRTESGKARKDKERDFLLSVLNASTTKRDAKSYLSRFSPTTSPEPTSHNLSLEQPPPLYVALIKIRLLQDLPSDIVDGLVQTLSQLSRLGISCVVVLDGSSDDTTNTPPSRQLRKQNSVQVDRLVSALEANADTKAQFLDSAIGVSEEEEVTVQFGGPIRNAIIRGVIPVIPPTGFRTDTQQEVDVNADHVVLALTRHFASPDGTAPDSDITNTGPQSANVKGLLLDRIILLDPVGGIPSSSREDKAHVFLNLEQEYDSVRHELETAITSNAGSDPLPQTQPKTSGEPTTTFGSSNPFSKFAESETPGTSFLTEKPPSSSRTPPSTIRRHVANLDLLQRCLALLPPSSSALLSTPIEAATLPPTIDHGLPILGVQTRRPRNPLLFNLLTDRPLISSSLPVARQQHNPIPARAHPVTFIKHGMPLTMTPSPINHAWTPPLPGEPRMSLHDPRIDLPRLLALIEDSFRRPLDAEHYLSRIADRIAGVIVAGSYEGGAIVTWELPAGVPDDGSASSRARMVPYLDKFAVRQRSQGAGGVADIVFSAMVRSCLPQGVCWRSRKNNPVNKWYFERSAGTWKLPDLEWTMFWTTEGLGTQKGRFEDYESVCRNVMPSWADNKQLLD